MELSDRWAFKSSAVLGVGVALVPNADAQPQLEAGRLVRLLPQWYSDAGAISVYFASRSQLPAKTRVFIDIVTALTERNQWPEQFAGSLGYPRHWRHYADIAFDRLPDVCKITMRIEDVFYRCPLIEALVPLNGVIKRYDLGVDDVSDR